MSLVGPYLTTTSYKKREVKVTKAKQKQLEEDWRARNVRLKTMGEPKETFEQFLEWVYGRGKKETVQKTSRTKRSAAVAEPNKSPKPFDQTDRIFADSSGLAVAKLPGADTASDFGGCTKKSSPTYTGSAMIGIAQMHKSNAVPVFSDEEVKDISKMRR